MRNSLLLCLLILVATRSISRGTDDIEIKLETTESKGVRSETETTQITDEIVDRFAELNSTSGQVNLINATEEIPYICVQKAYKILVEQGKLTSVRILGDYALKFCRIMGPGPFTDVSPNPGDIAVDAYFAQTASREQLRQYWGITPISGVKAVASNDADAARDRFLLLVNSQSERSEKVEQLLAFVRSNPEKPLAAASLLRIRHILTEGEELPADWTTKIFEKLEELPTETPGLAAIFADPRVTYKRSDRPMKSLLMQAALAGDANGLVKLRSILTEKDYRDAEVELLISGMDPKLIGVVEAMQDFK